MAQPVGLSHRGLLSSLQPPTAARPLCAGGARSATPVRPAAAPVAPANPGGEARRRQHAAGRGAVLRAQADDTAAVEREAAVDAVAAALTRAYEELGSTGGRGRAQGAYVRSLPPGAALVLTCVLSMDAGWSAPGVCVRASPGWCGGMRWQGMLTGPCDDVTLSCRCRGAGPQQAVGPGRNTYVHDVHVAMVQTSDMSIHRCRATQRLRVTPSLA